MPRLESLETRPLTALDHVIPGIEDFGIAVVVVLRAIQIRFPTRGNDGDVASSANGIGGAVGVPAMSVSGGGLFIDSGLMSNVIVLSLH